MICSKFIFTLIVLKGIYELISKVLFHVKNCLVQYSSVVGNSILTLFLEAKRAANYKVFIINDDALAFSCYCNAEIIFLR